MPRSLRLAALLLLLSLGGCAHHEGALYNAPPPPGLDERLDTSMHAMVEAFPDLTDEGPMITAAFVDVDDPTRAAPLGRIAAELAAATLARAGMPVREVLIDGGELLTYRGQEGLLIRQIHGLEEREDARSVLLGTYATGHDTLYLALRVVDTRNGRVLASHTLGLPLDGDLRALLRPR